MSANCGIADRSHVCRFTCMWVAFLSRFSMLIWAIDEEKREATLPSLLLNIIVIIVIYPLQYTKKFTKPKSMSEILLERGQL